MIPVVLASSNPHKIEELQRVLASAGLPCSVTTTASFGRPPAVPETGATFVENARRKAEGYDAWLADMGAPARRLVLADDSGICVDALGGAPGVRSARFAGEGATDADNNRALVRALSAAGVDRSPAHYACVIALLDRAPGRVPTCRTFEGRWPVEVRAQPRGTGGFGYDPHAYLPDGRTVAQLPSEDKDRLSHRGQALRALVAYLSTSLPREKR